MTRRPARRRRPHVARAVRVALVATLVIVLASATVAVAVDLFLGRRVLWEVDQRLTLRLADVSRLADPLASVSPPADQGTDGAPVFVWWVGPHGATALTSGAPPLPPAVRADPGQPRTVRTAGATYRFEVTPWHGGWLVAGQNMAGPSHIVSVLVTAEVLIAPVVALLVFAGVLVIALQAVAPVEAARRRQLELAADASHELRTPLTVIEAELALARDAGDEAILREALLHVGRESARLRRIVEDLLWLARFDSAPPPEPVPVDVAAVARAGAARFEAVARARRLRLTVAAPAAGPGDPGGEEPSTWIDADPEWMDKLVGTLLDNACRYAPSGGAVRVSVAGRGGRVLLAVADSGPGIPEPERAALFDRFRRASSSPGGAGLGLAIADSVVRSTGGRWRVDDADLGGASMEVSWRAATRGRPPPARAVHAGDGEGPEAGRAGGGPPAPPPPARLQSPV